LAGLIDLAARSLEPGWNNGQSYLLNLRTGSTKEETMGFGRGLLLWLIGIPLPIIILLALFWHH
jgi:hypothetical protein